MPTYLVVIFLILLVVSIIGTFWFDFMNFSSFKAKEYFMLSSTGLTLTLALFVAGKNAFKDEDLKMFAKSKHPENKREDGYVLLDFLAPYVFTSIIFLSTGLTALFCPFLQLDLVAWLLNLMKIIYINALCLGLLSLFNLVNLMLNDVLYSSFRE